jgi:large subunit ribosomal protein L10
MSLNLAEKQAVVAEVAKVAASAHSAIAAEYRGLSVAQITSLRVKARETGVYLRVVKNTLARRAVRGTEFECLQPSLGGTADSGVLTGGPRRGGAAVQGISEGKSQRQAGRQGVGGKRTGISSQRAGSFGQPADPQMRRSACSWRLHEGAARQVRAEPSMKFPASWCARSKRIRQQKEAEAAA